MSHAVAPDVVAGRGLALAGEINRPRLGPGLVRRQRLIERLLGTPSARLVLLTAPAGYSKTTCLAEWAAADKRPFAWVSANQRHDDGALLVTAVVEALGEIEPVDPDILASLGAPNPSILAVTLPRLSRSLGERSEPVVLVIDDVHLLSSKEAFEVLEALIEMMPQGFQLALASRTEPPLALARRRAYRQLVELTQRDLAMSRAESGELLDKLGLKLTPAQGDLLFERTEGWPAALSLAGIALAGQKDTAAAVASFAGDDRIVGDYLRDEFLGATTPATLGFLTRTSVLEELTGPLCDATLDQSGSGKTLRDLARSNSLIIHLDRHEDRYRYHHLFAEMLQAELRRGHPDLEPVLHARASDWYADQFDHDRAIEHAIAAGDLERIATMVWNALPEFIGRGRVATIGRWLAEIGDDRAASSGRLAVTAAHRCLALGEGARAAHWARIADGISKASGFQGESIEPDLLLVQATLGTDGVTKAGQDAERALELFPAESPWRVPCFFYLGVSRHLTGASESAVAPLQEAARRGAVAVPIIQVLALSQLSLIATDAADPDTALRLMAQAREQVTRCGLVDYSIVAMVYATSAMASANDGQVERAHAAVADAKRLLLNLADFIPWFEAQVKLVLARACARLDDLESARILLQEADGAIKRTPDALALTRWMKESQASVGSAFAEGRGEEWALTKAEVRTLQYLPSHLAFREIGERIHLSPNTVKTQAQGIYRKLGASSRAEAVEKARNAGLLGDDPLGER